MSSLVQALQNLSVALDISTEQLQAIARNFHQAMLDGMSGKGSSLKMLPSYLTVPTGTEKGQFLALDFGGTNVRVLLTELSGQGTFSTVNRCSKPLKSPEHYDYLCREATGQELFDFITSIIKEVLPERKIYPLGHTFSFPIDQTGLNRGTLIYWTKEIETRGVVGQDITTLLTEALARNNLAHVVPKVILNDTVGTLLTAAYADQTVDIGCICGTGHNTAYLEPCSPLTGKPMIINMESGNFDQLPFTQYDNLLDSNSEQPGRGRLEKMTSGRYIGELLRLTACDLIAQGLLSTSPDKETLQVPNLLSGEDVAVFAGDASPDGQEIRTWLENRLHITGSTPQDRQALRQIAALVVTRAARLITATFIGIFLHIDPALDCRHTIAVDGSLYEKMPGFAPAIDQALTEVFGPKAANLATMLSKDGSGIGAAIATATVA